MIDPAYIDINRQLGQLKKRLEAYHEEARRNQQLHHRFQAVELSLLAAGDFVGVVEVLQSELKASFNLEAVTLVLIDTRGEINHALCAGGPMDGHCGALRLVGDNADVLHIKRLGKEPQLGRYDADLHDWLLGGSPSGPGSLALLPLYRQDDCLGCLCLFSSNPKRYAADAATDFQARLAAVIAICIENGLKTEYLRRQSLTDALTGLSNRRELEKRLAEELNRAQRDGSPLSCLYLDADFFKRVNDSYGHDAGDLVLQHIAALMLQMLRRGDVVARYGGEEFVVLLPGVSTARAVETAERLRRAVESTPIDLGPKENLSITISIGVACLQDLPKSPVSLQEAGTRLIADADQALYMAKQQGRNRVIKGSESSC
jgi:two-component system cell cycle response regulator